MHILTNQLASENIQWYSMHPDEAYMGYIKGKLLGLSISDMPDSSCKCENPEFQKVLVEHPEYLQENFAGIN